MCASWRLTSTCTWLANSSTSGPRTLTLVRCHWRIRTWTTFANNKALVKKPLTRLALALVMYTEEGCLSRTPPSPNVCGLVTTADLVHLEKTPLVAEILEQTLAKMEKDWRPILTNAHGHQNHEVAFLVRAFQLLMARAALRKTFDPVFGPCTVLTGKLTVEKANELACFWAKSVDSKFPSLNFSKVTGLSKF